MSFGRDTKRHRSLLYGVYARGSKRSHTGGKCVTCRGRWTPHSNLEKDNSLNHSCVSPNMGCAPYCSQLWVNHTKCSYNKLRVAYNNAYRRVLGYVKSDSASNMFVNNQVDNFDAHNRHLIYSLRSRILNCNNSIVVCLNDCFYIRGRYMWTSWQKSLYTV